MADILNLRISSFAKIYGSNIMDNFGKLQKINQTDTAVVISGVTKSAVGSGRKIQRTPSITSWNREIKIPKGINPDSGPVLKAPIPKLGGHAYLRIEFLSCSCSPSSDRNRSYRFLLRNYILKTYSKLQFYSPEIY